MWFRPMIAFIGVRISWLMLARKALLARFASSACARAVTNSAVRLATSSSSRCLCADSSACSRLCAETSCCSDTKWLIVPSGWRSGVMVADSMYSLPSLRRLMNSPCQP